MKNLKAVYILAGVLLTACTVGPDYERPDVSLAAKFPEGQAAGEAIAAQWWKGFGDAQLNQFIDKALVANADLKVAVARVEEASAGLDNVASAQLPEIDATGGYTKSKVSGSGYAPLSDGRNRTVNRVGLVTSFELDFWGKLRRATEGAKAQLLGAQEARMQVELAVTSSVVRAYAALRSTDIQARAAEEIRTVRAEELRVIEERFKVGSAGPSDRAVAEINLATAITVQSDAARTRAQAQHLLGFLIGQPDLVVASDSSVLWQLPPAPAAGLPSDLLRCRPDVIVAEQALIAANAKIGYTKAAYFPTFSLTGVLGSESKSFSNLFSSGSATHSLGVDLSVPLFDYGRTASRVEGAVAVQHQAAATYEKTVFNAFREVRDALVDVRETMQAADAAMRRENSSREAFRVAEAKQGQGQIGPIEFLLSRRLLAESQAAVAKVRYDRVIAQVDLIKALGGARVEAVVVKE